MHFSLVVEHVETFLDRVTGFNLALGHPTYSMARYIGQSKRQFSKEFVAFSILVEYIKRLPFVTGHGQPAGCQQQRISYLFSLQKMQANWFFSTLCFQSTSETGQLVSTLFCGPFLIQASEIVEKQPFGVYLHINIPLQYKACSTTNR